MSTTSALLRLHGSALTAVQATWRALDEAGCDTLYLTGDFAVCAAMAVQTRRARICCITHSRDASFVSEAADTLQYLSNGRFVLGVGPITDDVGPFGSVTASEFLLEEVRTLVHHLPVTLFGQGGGPFRLATEHADNYLTDVASDHACEERQKANSSLRALSRTTPLHRALLLSTETPPGEPLDTDELVRPLNHPLASTEAAAEWLAASRVENGMLA